MKLIDQFDDEPESWFNHWAVLYLPIAIFILGVLMLFLNWPGNRLVILVGLFALLVRSVLFFFRKKRTAVDWVYFVARIVFTLSIGLQLTFQLRFSFTVQMSIIGLYVFGAFVKLFAKSSHKNENETTDDD